MSDTMRGAAEINKAIMAIGSSQRCAFLIGPESRRAVDGEIRATAIPATRGIRIDRISSRPIDHGVTT